MKTTPQATKCVYEKLISIFQILVFATTQITLPQVFAVESIISIANTSIRTTPVAAVATPTQNKTQTYTSTETVTAVQTLAPKVLSKVEPPRSAVSKAGVSLNNNQNLPAVPEGWTRAKSNPNFAFAYSSQSNRGYTSTSLSVQDLTTGKVTYLARASFPNGAVSNVYDVSPNGKYVIYSTVSHPSIFQTSIQRLDGSEKTLTIATELKGVSFQNGIFEILGANYYPNGTVVGEHYQITNGTAVLKKETLIKKGESAITDETNHLLIIKDLTGSQSSGYQGTLVVYDTTAGLDQMQRVAKWSVGSGYPIFTGGDFKWDVYHLGTERIVSISIDRPDWNDYRVQTTTLINMETKQQLTLTGFTSAAKQEGSLVTYTLELSGAELARTGLSPHRTVTVDLQTMQESVSLPAVPQGWKLMPSNPNFAYGYGSVQYRPGRTSNYLEIMDLRTGEKKSIDSFGEFTGNYALSDVIDISPDGTYLIHGHNDYRNAKGWEVLVSKPWSNPPSEKAVVPGKLIAVQFLSKDSAKITVDVNGVKRDYEINLATGESKAIELSKPRLTILPSSRVPQGLSVIMDFPTPGRYRLEKSQDLKAWTSIKSYTIQTSGTKESYVFVPEGDSQNYFRLVPDLPTSPNGLYQVQEEGDSLVVKNNRGDEIGRIRVSAQQVRLLSYNITNRGVYYALDQRSNPSIHFASFENLTRSEAVTIPNGLSLLGSAIEWVKGRPEAYITNLDLARRLVNFEQGAVRTGPMVPVSNLTDDHITPLLNQISFGHVSLGSETESIVRDRNGQEVTIEYDTSAAGPLEDFAGGGFHFNEDPKIVPGMQAIVVGLKADTPTAQLEITDTKGNRLSIEINNLNPVTESIYSIPLTELTKAGVDYTTLRTVLMIVEGAGKKGTLQISFSQDLASGPDLLPINAQAIQYELPVPYLTNRVNLVSLNQDSHVDYSPRGISIDYDVTHLTWAGGGINLVQSGFPEGEREKIKLSDIHSGFIDIGISSTETLPELKLEIKGDALSPLPIVFYLKNVQVGKENIYRIPVQELKKQGLSEIQFIMLVPELTKGEKIGRLNLNFFANPRNNIVNPGTGIITPLPKPGVMHLSSQPFRFSQIEPTAQGLILSYQHTNPIDWTGAGLTFDNFATPIEETVNLSQSPNLVFGLKGDAQKVKVEFRDANQKYAALYLQGITQIQQMYSISTSMLKEVYGIDLSRIKEILFTVDVSSGSSSGKVEINVGRDLRDYIPAASTTKPITPLYRTPAEVSHVSLGSKELSQVKPTARGAEITMNNGAVFGSERTLAGGGILFKKPPVISSETKEIVLGIQTDAQDLIVEFKDQSGKQVQFEIRNPQPMKEQNYSFSVDDLKSQGLNLSQISNIILMTQDYAWRRAFLNLLP